MSKYKNKSRTYLTINLPDQKSLHLSAKEISSDLTEEEVASKEVQRLIQVGMLVKVSE